MRTTTTKRALIGSLIAAALLVPVCRAAAHDFWIQPESFTPAPDTPIGIGLFVGDQGAASEVRRWPGRIVRFDAVAAGSATAIPGLARQMPAGLLHTPAGGVVTLLYEGAPEHIELPAEKFEAYLAEEGLEDVLAARRRLGESAAPGRESYARSCKSLLRVDGTSDPGAERTRTGLRLELVADRAPSQVRTPERLPFTLWFEGAPLAGRLVELVNLDDATVRFEGGTDAEGRVHFPAPPPGRWMVATVHMRRAAPDADADWESFWGTLTFEVPARVPEPAVDVEYSVFGGPEESLTLAFSPSLLPPTGGVPSDLGAVEAAIALRSTIPTALGTTSIFAGAAHSFGADATRQAEARLGLALDVTERLIVEGGLALGLPGDARDVAVNLGATWLPF